MFDIMTFDEVVEKKLRTLVNFIADCAGQKADHDSNLIDLRHQMRLLKLMKDSPRHVPFITRQQYMDIKTL